MSFLIVMVLLLVVMYVLMIRPQRQRQRDQQSMIRSAGVGDDILTTGGIYGTITRAEGDDVVVEIGDETKVNVHDAARDRGRAAARGGHRAGDDRRGEPSRSRTTMNPRLREAKKPLRATPTRARPRPTAANLVREP